MNWCLVVDGEKTLDGFVFCSMFWWVVIAVFVVSLLPDDLYLHPAHSSFPFFSHK